jgi:hypothetical protein
LHFTQEAEAFLLSSSSSWSQLAAAVVVVVLLPSDIADLHMKLRFVPNFSNCK